MKTNDKNLKNKQLIPTKVIALISILVLILIAIIIHSLFVRNQVNKLTSNINQCTTQIAFYLGDATTLLEVLELSDPQRDAYISELTNLITVSQKSENNKFNTCSLLRKERNNIALATYLKNEFTIAKNLKPILTILNSYSTTALPSSNDINTIKTITNSALASKELEEMIYLYNNNIYVQSQLQNSLTPKQIQEFLNSELSANQSLADLKKY